MRRPNLILSLLLCICCQHPNSNPMHASRSTAQATEPVSLSRWLSAQPLWTSIQSARGSRFDSDSIASGPERLRAGRPRAQTQNTEYRSWLIVGRAITMRRLSGSTSKARTPLYLRRIDSSGVGSVGYV
ncbi:hypothetical protein OF83DRAFT_461087 [Amylostereum chailletii]|nr:hypothetical protein OF83DRAFT_461087 [Amylostereum chailletii]